MVFPLAAASFIMNIVAVVFVFVAVALIIIVLIQKGKGGGLSSAFGGAGGSSGVFGSKTGDFLTWTTIAVAGLFLVLAVLMSRFYRPAEVELGPTPTSAPTAPAQPTPAPVAPAAPAAPTKAPVAPAVPAQAPAAPAASPINAPSK